MISLVGLANLIAELLRQVTAIVGAHNTDVDFDAPWVEQVAAEVA